MSDQIITAIIGAIATIAAAVIGLVGSDIWRDRESSLYRRRLGLPDPLGAWRCEWFLKDESLYVADEVKIEKWVTNGRFRGLGTQPALSYSVEGEIDSTRVMALTYRTVDFPNKAYVGVACLVFDTDGNTLTGHWYGRVKSGEFTGGKTEWHRR